MKTVLKNRKDIKLKFNASFLKATGKYSETSLHITKLTVANTSV